MNTQIQRGLDQVQASPLQEVLTQVHVGDVFARLVSGVGFDTEHKYTPVPASTPSKCIQKEKYTKHFLQ